MNDKELTQAFKDFFLREFPKMNGYSNENAQEIVSKIYFSGKEAIVQIAVENYGIDREEVERMAPWSKFDQLAKSVI